MSALSLEDLWALPGFRRWLLDAVVVQDFNAASLRQVHEWWAARYPEVDWQICAKDGCDSIISLDEPKCGKHGHIPRYRLARGTLWKALSHRHGARGKDREKRYVDFSIHQAETKNGGPWDRRLFQVVAANGNPMDMRKDNLILVSKYAATLVKACDLRLDEAEHFDSEIADFLKARTKGGRPPFKGRYSYHDIARLLNRSAASIRADVTREKFNPAKLRYVVDYINRYRKTRE